MEFKDYDTLSSNEILERGENAYIEIMNTLKENFDFLDEVYVEKILENANLNRQRLRSGSGVYLKNACIVLETTLFNLNRKIEQIKKYNVTLKTK